MENTSKKWLNFSLVFGIIAAILISNISFTNSCKEMYENIIRIRIIANSDTAEDQALKLNIRDAVLESSKEVFNGIKDYNEAEKIAAENIENFKETAQKIVNENGFNYNVDLKIKDEFFDTREYDDFTLPAGTYKSLVFTVGEGNGQNWWCVMFPEVCVGGCSGRLNDSLSDDSANVAYNSDKYIIKFKTVEIFENIKTKIKNFH
ncbi:MAG: stage II sporulation protein R [Clostridia bacterium]|nr:stage II sporulation protein R [Clostridia bacterium]